MCAQYTQTYAFTNGTSADGGQVNTEVVNLGTSVNSITNDQVAAAAAIAISKTTLTYTAPTNYVPVWSTGFTQPAIGNGSLGGRYERIGKTVRCYASLSFGSSTTYGTGDWFISLPLTAETTGALGTVRGFDSGATFYTGTAVLASSTTIQIYSNAVASPWNKDTPITWATNDTIIIEIVYEAA